MIAYVDDQALMITTKEVRRLVEAANESVEKVIGWMNCRNSQTQKVRVGGCAVQSREDIKFNI